MVLRHLAVSFGLSAAASGCSLLSLDVLQAGAEGGGTSVGTTSTSGETSSTGPTAGSGGGGGEVAITAVASTGGGDGGAGGAGGTGDGGASSTSAGGGCPDVCEGVDATFCDAFDGGQGLSAWGTTRGFEEGSTFEIVTDPHVSCPNAAQITFTGVTQGNPGGWAQIQRVLDGSPMAVTLTAHVRRMPTDPAMEGVMEFYWASGEQQCLVQVQMATEPPAIQFYAGEFDPFGAGTPMGGEHIDLGDTSTVETWIELELALVLGAQPSAKLTVGDGVSRSFPLDPDAMAECDENPPNPDGFSVLLGAPYNQAATKLTYDDVVIRAE